MTKKELLLKGWVPVKGTAMFTDPRTGKRYPLAYASIVQEQFEEKAAREAQAAKMAEEEEFLDKLRSFDEYDENSWDKMEAFLKEHDKKMKKKARTNVSKKK